MNNDNKWLMLYPIFYQAKIIISNVIFNNIFMLLCHLTINLDYAVITLKISSF